MYHISPYSLYITTSKCACTKSNLCLQRKCYYICDELIHLWYVATFTKTYGARKCNNLGRNFRKMPNLVESLDNHLLFEILENRNFCRNFWKVSILARSVQKSLFWSEFSKNLTYNRYFRKITILVEIFEKYRFWSKFSKNLDLGSKFLKKSQFGGNLF